MSFDAEPVVVDHGPARLSTLLSLLLATVAVAATAPSSVGLPLALGGLAGVALGLLSSDSRRLVTLGAAALVAGSFAGGAFGLPVELVLTAVTSAVLAWDIGENAISTGRQLGRGADTRRSELVHAAASIIVGVAVAAGGYVVFRFAAGGKPVAALALLLLGAVLLLWSAGR